LRLVEQLDSDQLNRVWSPILSPLVWDLGHIANFEELWLVQRVAGSEPLDGSLGELYDAIAQPRKVRGELPILPPEQVFPYLQQVRERTLEALEAVDLDPDVTDPLLRDGFVYELILAHEHQHNETMLQLLQLVPGYDPPDLGETAPAGAVGEGPEMVECVGGMVEIGAGDHGFAYDNERPRHTVEIEPFLIDRTPVTNGEYQRFLAETDTEPPMYWVADGDGSWHRERFGRSEEIAPDSPVVHVSHQEAEAFAVWAGKRMPSEFEWEAAAAGSDREQANLDHFAWDVSPAGAVDHSASDCGAVQMFGDVWEWTASDFESYPGFQAFPYEDYSQTHYGQGFKVLRGGAWATRRHTIRQSFRNWDLAERKQIFSGFRCAKDST
jgi:iron(II)-dependent oxidoreductase